MVLLIDTFSLFFRAFFALPAMSTQTGEPTSAVYGTSSLLLKLLREYPNSELAFALDAPQATFRHEAFEGYKAQRSGAPDELLVQFRRLDELLEALAVPRFRVPGFEADDVLATLAAERAARGQAVLIVSGDRDLLQLVNDFVKVLFVGGRGKDAVTYDRTKVLERFALPPERLPSYVALVGDPSDNLPSVPGVGPGTASKLLASVSDCSELLSHLDSVKPERVRAALAEHAEQILMTEKLARLQRDVPLGEGVRSRALTLADLERVRRLFEELEFKSLLPRLDKLREALT